MAEAVCCRPLLQAMDAFPDGLLSKDAGLLRSMRTIPLPFRWLRTTSSRARGERMSSVAITAPPPAQRARGEAADSLLWRQASLLDSSKVVGRPDKGLGEAWVAEPMSRIVHDHQLGLGPDAAEFPGVGDGSLKVKAPVHQDARNGGQDARPAQ